MQDTTYVTLNVSVDKFGHFDMIVNSLMISMRAAGFRLSAYNQPTVVLVSQTMFCQ